MKVGTGGGFTSSGKKTQDTHAHLLDQGFKIPHERGKFLVLESVYRPW